MGQENVFIANGVLLLPLSASESARERGYEASESSGFGVGESFPYLKMYIGTVFLPYYCVSYSTASQLPYFHAQPGTPYCMEEVGKPYVSTISANAIWYSFFLNIHP